MQQGSFGSGGHSVPGRCIIMFQAFDWGSHKVRAVGAPRKRGLCRLPRKAPSWYKVLLGLLPELRSAGSKPSKLCSK